MLIPPSIFTMLYYNLRRLFTFFSKNFAFQFLLAVIDQLKILVVFRKDKS